jgi:choline dehydrogenase-like flavoprotein
VATGEPHTAAVIVAELGNRRRYEAPALEPYVIVGAGPAAAATAKALVALGRQVVVLDTALALEPERDAARQRMATTTPARWSATDIALTRYSAEGASGAGYKRLFGSDLAFRDDGVFGLSAGPDVGARPSYAIGGLSNVWGAGVLPYADRDLEGWPLSASELTDAYAAVFDFIPYAAEEDELCRRYPLVVEPDGPLIRSEAGEALLARLRRHRRALAAAGYDFGASRLAVRVGHPAPAKGCVYCAHCLDGCPYGHIYNAAQTIEQLRGERLIDYRPGLHVDRVRERDGAVLVEATPLDGGPAISMSAARVFLAAGAVSSTVILQRSALLPERTEILDSQTLYMPFAWVGRTGRTGREPGHTLAQAFLVLDDPAVCAHPVHISLYTYNDGLSERARAAHPRLSSLIGPMLDGITRRLVIGICFFHSEDSHRILSACRPASRSVRLEPVLNAAAPAIVARFQRALRRSLAPIGLVPLAPLAEIPPPGGGYHYGGSLPMRSRPSAGEADTLGRPLPSQRIHAVDAACFPSIPGGTITFPAMANAYRIATNAALQDQP